MDRVHLELVSCSSEDENFPATNLTRSYGTQRSVWVSEKFCEFPQELVFRVNRGFATRIEQVNLLSHPFKVATRVEIFTSSAANDGIRDTNTAVRFERLGFVSFLNSESTNLTACELQEIQLPRPAAKITLLRLVLHSCHQTRSNLFSQVGLASVVALGASEDTYVVLPMIPSPKKIPDKSIQSPSIRSPRQRIVCVTDKTAIGPVLQVAVKSSRAKTSTETSVVRKTPEQVCADIQIGKQLALFAGDDNFVQPWVALEQEANQLMDLQENKQQVHANVGNTLQKFAGLEQRRQREEERLSKLVSSSKGQPESNDGGVSRHRTDKDVLNKLRTGNWQERETLLWQLVKCSQRENGGESQLCFQLESMDAETVEVLIAALHDSNDQVFVASCAFLRVLLSSSPYFQDQTSSKTDLVGIVDTLLERLSSHESSVRNVAAFTLLKIAGSTRTRGTFVTHLLLKHVESSVQPTDQLLLALLKLLTALLLSFHCCASCDIAPRRITRFLLHSDADQHENALIRNAAKQLVLALCIDVDEKFVLKHYIQKLPLENQRRYKINS